MSERLRSLRRGATAFAVRQAIGASALLPAGPQRALPRALVGLGAGIPPLRRRVAAHMRLALGEGAGPPGAEARYFSRLAWSLSGMLATYHRGIAATPVPAEVAFDASLALVDEAVAVGRGVVLAAPHWIGHELVAAVLARRHQMTMLVRPGSSPERTAQKLRWYGALGVETVLRPRGASALRDAAAYLRVLRQGRLLALTPDLLADPGQGVPVRIFGRAAGLHGGAFALALAAQAPLLQATLRWPSDSSIVCTFERADMARETPDRDAAVRAGLQDWCVWFERSLRAAPENWLFWLDKRWSRFLRETHPGAAAE